MKGPLGFGGPKQHRISMQFGYNTKPSFWQQLQTNSHLVIAAVGTVALGIFLFREPATVARLVCVGLIVTGILGLKLFTPPHA